MAQSDHQRIEKIAEKTERELANRDPISGAPGAHPVGVGVGAAGGGAAGAAAGAIGGPVGAVVGAGIGAVVGGLAGKAVAEGIDPTVETGYWRDNYLKRPYSADDAAFEQYEPAYRYGWESAAFYPARHFADVETDLAREWDRRKGKSTLTWEQARPAIRDAWDRIVARRSGGKL